MTGIGAGLLALLVGVGLAVSQAQGAPRGGSGPDLVDLGPIPVGHGFVLSVDASDCGARDSQVTLAFTRRHGTVFLEHSYTGPGTCAAGSRLAAATIRAHWRGVLDIDLRLVARGPLRCTGAGLQRPEVGAGRFDLRVHPAVFGAKHDSRLTAGLTAVDVGSCGSAGGGGLPITGLGTIQSFARRIATAAAVTTTTTTTTTRPTPTPDGHGSELLAVFGGGDKILIGVALKHTTATIFLDNERAPSPGIQAAFEAAVLSRSAYAPGSTFATGTIHGARSAIQGVLTFTEVPPVCRGAAANGKLSGVITVHDPILGPVRYIGRHAPLVVQGDVDTKAVIRCLVDGASNLS